MKSDDAKQIVNDKSKHLIYGKPILIRPCSIEEFEEVFRQQNSGKAIIDVPHQSSQKMDKDDLEDDMDDIDDVIAEDERFLNDKEQSDCVFLYGLPFKITERDVADFFSDISVVPTRIHIRSHGECFCEFMDERKAEIALEKDRTNLGTNVVFVETISRSDMERALSCNNLPSNSGNRMHSPGPPCNHRFSFGRPGPGPGPGPRPPGLMGLRPPSRRPGPGQPGPGPMLGCTVSMANVPYKASKEEISEFFEGFDVNPDNVLRRSENGKPTGDAIVTFNSPAEAQRAVEEGNHQMLRDRTIFLSLGSGPGGPKSLPFERNAFEA